jgi:hypothetical protein
LFWFQDKPWYLLVDGVPLDEIFEPMRRRQLSHLADRREIQGFLERLPIAAVQKVPLATVATEIVKAVDEARVQQAHAMREANLARLAASLPKGPPDVDPALVQSLKAAGALGAAVELALRSDNSVSLRQIACALVALDELDAAAKVAQRVPNRAERRSVGVAALEVIAEGHSNPQRLKDFVADIYRSVRDPQRRDLRDAAAHRGVAIDWPTVEPNP